MNPILRKFLVKLVKRVLFPEGSKLATRLKEDLPGLKKAVAKTKTKVDDQIIDFIAECLK